MAQIMKYFSSLSEEIRYTKRYYPCLPAPINTMQPAHEVSALQTKDWMVADIPLIQK